MKKKNFVWKKIFSFSFSFFFTFFSFFVCNSEPKKKQKQKQKQKNVKEGKGKAHLYIYIFVYIFAYIHFYLSVLEVLHKMTMTPDDIRKAATNLDKAKEANDVTTILNILSELESVNATEALLRETKIGVHVNKLKNFDNSKIVSQVKKIVKKWKDQVVSQKKPNKMKKISKREPSADESGSLNTNNNSSSNNKTNSNENSNESNKILGPRNPKTDGIKIEPYAESTRNSSVSALYVALGLSTNVPSTKILEISTKIEDGIYKEFNSEVNNNYRNKLRSLIMSLRNKNNAPLRDSVLEMDILPEKLIKMTSQELAPEALKQQLQTLHQKNLFDAQGAVEKRAVTDRFVCGKCKQREVSYYQMQTRSADEPLTTFCTCEKCGNRWKFC